MYLVHWNQVLPPMTTSPEWSDCLIYTVFGKNISDIFDCNLKKDYQILIIFDTNISDRAGDQMTVQFFTASIFCFCTTWGNKINKILHFILFHLFGFPR